MKTAAQIEAIRHDKAGYIQRFFFDEVARYEAAGDVRAAARVRVAQELLTEDLAARLYDVVQTVVDARR